MRVLVVYHCVKAILVTGRIVFRVVYRIFGVRAEDQRVCGRSVRVEVLDNATTTEILMEKAHDFI